MSTDYERLGGAEGLVRIFESFLDTVMDDFIIGFFFVGKDRQRLLAREVEHASGHLGGPDTDTGRPLDRVHKPLPIDRGHFRCRLALMRKALVAHDVDEDIIERWIEHEASLIDRVVGRDVDCVD